MITKELVKAEVDKVQDKYLEVLYRIIKALINSPELAVIAPDDTIEAQTKTETSSWHNFIEQTYGCLADDPIERGEQGQYEVREAIE